MVTALVVDDVLKNRRLYEKHLCSLGLEVKLAENGLIALDVLRANKIDVIFLDYNMPLMNGFEFLEELPKSSRTEIPVIMISTDIRASQIAVISKGAWDWLPKPSTLQMLKQTLQAYKVI